MNPVLMIVLVAMAGGFGAALRLILSSWVTTAEPDALPRGTWLVNLLGSGMLGVLTPPVAAGLICPCWFTILAGGLLGALTTFSTWMVELITLAERRQLIRAVLHLFGQFTLGIIVYAAGHFAIASLIG